MSSWVVDDSTINLIVTEIVVAAQKNEFSGVPPPPPPKLYPDPNIPGTRLEGWSRLAKAMRKMNEAAVKARYGDEGAASMIPKEPLKFVATKPCSPAQLVKSLDCLLYQCSEGKVPSQKLYKLLAEYRDDVCRAIVENTPEYKAAEWK